jgi:Ca2+-binding RTX toxin-like protein
MIGINIAGAEFGSGRGGLNDREYHWPTLSELQFYQGKGVDLVRIPFTWERMQPILGGALNGTELGLLKTLLSDAASLGMDVIIDLHNYGRYDGQTIGSAGGPTAAQFADFWVKLVGEVKGFTSLVGYDLMNEPHDMPSANAWKDAAQAAVDAIRTVDMAKTIFVEGNDWSGAYSWVERNANFIINDPANKLVYQAHQYFDRDSSGTYAGSYDQEGAYANVGVDRIKPFVDWLNTHGFKGMIGETGAPSDDPRWLDVMKNALDYMKANDLVVTAWGGGTWWPSSYSMFMGAPGQADSKFLDLLEGYFTPWKDLGTAVVTPPAPVAPVVETIAEGTSGADQIKGTAGADDVRALGGDDTVSGSAGADRIDGGVGLDFVDYSFCLAGVNVDLTRAIQSGGFAEGDRLSGIENLVGSAFNDRLAGDPGANRLAGGAGDDTLTGRGGADRLDGGTGIDTASYEGSAAGVNIDLGRTTQSGGDAQGDVLIDIEKIVGSAWADSFKGNSAANSFDGGDGNDMFEGLAGADTITGGAGTDTASYASSNARVDVNLYWASQKSGHAEGDRLSGIENITGSKYGDSITGNGDNNLLDGGAGDDWLNGSWGADLLRGGAGKDRFVFDSVGNANGDRVLDFAPREDKLDFSAIDANSGVAGDQAFFYIGSKEFTGAAGQLRAFVKDGSTWITGDVDGDGVGEFTVALTGLFTLTSTHFTL